MKAPESLDAAVQRVRQFMKPRGAASSSTNAAAAAAGRAVGASGPGQQSAAVAAAAGGGDPDDLVISDGDDDIVVGNRWATVTLNVSADMYQPVFEQPGSASTKGVTWYTAKTLRL